ncbi:MAG: NADH-quinone oxidoreductase subunit NuoE [Candidatus Omnitrophica bacterium]|nr:NADH-quinone oxidoreductase subunit NuoE [Candidatus Omnitrophota bacterium]
MDKNDKLEWKAKVDEIIEKQGKTRNALLPCLKIIQEEISYISEEAINYLRERLDVSSVDIYGTITFYGMLTTQKQGEYVIRMCNSLPCYLNGSQKIIKILEDELGIKSGKTTSDGKFTLELVSCLGLCDKAPAMMVNKEIYGNLNEERLKQIIKLKKEK